MNESVGQFNYPKLRRSNSRYRGCVMNDRSWSASKWLPQEVASPPRNKCHGPLNYCHSNREFTLSMYRHDWSCAQSDAPLRRARGCCSMYREKFDAAIYWYGNPCSFITRKFLWAVSDISAENSIRDHPDAKDTLLRTSSQRRWDKPCASEKLNWLANRIGSLVSQILI